MDISKGFTIINCMNCVLLLGENCHISFLHTSLSFYEPPIYFHKVLYRAHYFVLSVSMICKIFLTKLNPYLC